MLLGFVDFIDKQRYQQRQNTKILPLNCIKFRSSVGWNIVGDIEDKTTQQNIYQIKLLCHRKFEQKNKIQCEEIL